MPDALIVSNAVLWVVVIVLALAVLALARQVGVLHERVAPAGALLPTSGPKVGELTEAASYRDLEGRQVQVGGPSGVGRPTLLLWVSPTCPVCRNLVPTAQRLARQEQLELILASDGYRLEQHRSYVRDLKLEGRSYIVSQALGLKFGVSKLPFAALVGADGTLRSKGLVNTREHLESMLESMVSGIETLQDYMRKFSGEPATADNREQVQ